MILLALRNRRTGRLLMFEPEAETRFDYWVTEEVQQTNSWLELRDSQFKGNVFVTSDENVIAELVRDGKSHYPEVRIDQGWNKTRFELTDLEVVSLQEKCDV